ncbi:hypothetical protein Tco_1122996 [Tanacetum coccineum]|uniref:Uncharacterized protein n=1 Tax=Tanacetum coccineum TaxID=301880 RepID=A0ABQ5J237_9ASTR
MGGEQEDKELYGDLNLNLDKRDAEMTDAHHYSRRRKRFTRLLTTNPPMKDAVNVAVQLQSNKLREEAQAENDEILKQIDSNIKAIIKDQVKTQVSKIMPKVEKYVTESLGVEVLARSSNQP